ncbi:THO complex subunit 4D-like protein [Drosera capensis]
MNSTSHMQKAKTPCLFDAFSQMDRALNMSLDDIIRSRRSSGRGRVRGAVPEGRVVRGSFGSGRIGRMGALRQRNFGVNSRPSAASIAKARLLLVIKYLRNQFKEERLESMGIRVAFYTLMKSSDELHGLQLDVVKNAEGVEKFIVFTVLISGFSISGFCFLRCRQSFRRSKNSPWQHDLIEESLAAAGITRSETDAKLFVSNLDSRVSNDDIRELFSEIGELKRYAIHFDRNGRPSGSAEVVYGRRSDAFAALKRYNNVQLDGRPMKIEILGPNSEAPLTARVNVIGGMNGRITRKVTLDQAVGGTRSLGPVNRGAGSRRRGGFQNGLGQPVQRAQPGTGVVPRITGKFQGRGRGRGRAQGLGWKKQSVKSATELDKELEKYHAEAMET